MKRWSIQSLIKTDLFMRAFPWSRLILSNPKYSTNLNTSSKERFTALAALCMPLFFVLAIFIHGALFIGFALCFAIFLNTNLRLFKLINRTNNFHTAACAMGLHWLYYVYSSAAFILTAIKLKLRPEN
jgi:hypothetical protein